VRTVDKILIRAPLDRVFELACNVEGWPDILPHYRWVRVLERRDGRGTVEMAAWRPFGPLRYPTWWVSEMRIDRAARAIGYRHLRGITRGMEVAWRFDSQTALGRSAVPGPPFRVGIGDDEILVTVVHAWRGPAWPLVGRIAANVVIGPVFIHGIASRTLAGIKREAERA
jgi:coenzyme Q-binding protein COQ10